MEARTHIAHICDPGLWAVSWCLGKGRVAPKKDGLRAVVAGCSGQEAVPLRAMEPVSNTSLVAQQYLSHKGLHSRDAVGGHRVAGQKSHPQIPGALAQWAVAGRVQLGYPVCPQPTPALPGTVLPTVGYGPVTTKGGPWLRSSLVKASRIGR